jgi:antitoxin MazE
MLAKIQKWGNSLALRIPSSMAKQLGIHQNTFVKIIEKGDKIIVEPIKKPRYTLQEMLSQINEENLHQEQNFGDSVGKEVW